jgi:hypothetical protein
METEHQEHSRGPAAEPLHADDRLDHLVVGELVQRVRGQFPADELRGEIAQVGDLLAAHARLAELLVGQREHGFGRHAVRHQRREASVNRRRGFGRNPLSCDHARERGNGSMIGRSRSVAPLCS